MDAGSFDVSWWREVQRRECVDRCVLETSDGKERWSSGEKYNQCG